MTHSIRTPIFEISRKTSQFLRKFLRAEDGIAAIEAAMLFPVAFLLLMGITEFSLMYYANTALNAAVKEIAAQATQECDAVDRDLNGVCPTTKSNEKLKTTELTVTVRKYAFGLIKPTDLCILATPVSLKSSGTSWPFGSAADAKPNFGGTDQVIAIDFRYKFKFVTIMIQNFFPNYLKFHSTFLVRNGTIASTTGRTVNWAGTNATNCAL